jgi:hypothetical protein
MIPVGALVAQSARGACDGLGSNLNTKYTDINNSLK